jgi:anti-anti-sigma factor
MGHAIESRPVDGTRHEVLLAGRLHAAAAGALRAALEGAVARARVVLVDATGLESVDAIALQALVAAASRLRAAGGTLVVFGVRPTVGRVLELTGVDRLVTVRPSREDALAAAA